MKTLEAQIADVQAAFPGTTVTPCGNGMSLMTLPGVPLPAGWTLSSTAVRFAIPNGYPFAAPDCFWADSALRLQTGMLPQNTAPHPGLPGFPGQPALWFSWHVNESWNPSRCDLMTYVRVIRNRFEALR